MKANPALASLFATGSIIALGFAAPAAAQTYESPFDPLSTAITAPVTAAGGIATAPLAATSDILLPGAPAVQSNRTAIFLANVIPNVDFLNDASRMALTRSSNPIVRSFAHRLAAEQTIAGNAMTAWAETNAPMLTGRSAYAGDPFLGLPALPINMLIGMGNAATGGLVVASNGHPLLRSGADNLAKLSSLSGRPFDILYRDTQLDSLQQLATLYSSYAVNGEDPGLRSLARSQLPKVRARIATLNRI